MPPKFAKGGKTKNGGAGAGAGAGTGAVEDRPRTSFTPGWEQSLSTTYALPIKQGSKIVRVTKQISERSDVSEEEGSDEEKEEVIKKGIMSKKQKQQQQLEASKRKNAAKKGKSPDSEQEDEDEDEDSEDEDTEDDDSTEGEEESVSENEKGQKGSSKAGSVGASSSVDDAGNKKEKKRKNKDAHFTQVQMVVSTKTPRELMQLQLKLADICTAITASPEKSFLKTREDTETKTKMDPSKITQLFDLLKSPDVQEFEMAMLSTVLVFKDICPSYRVRAADEYESDVVMKKENLALKKHELKLIEAYQNFLAILQSKVDSGLGSVKTGVQKWGVIEKLGLSAFRCQCELLKHLSHFNFRSFIMEAVIKRAVQPSEPVQELCVETLSHLFKKDTQCDLSYEAVQLITKTLTSAKYCASCRALLSTLHHIKVAVHADDSKLAHRNAKKERRKRKREEDDVSAGLMESNAVGDVAIKKRFQADSLRELCVLYFR